MHTGYIGGRNVKKRLCSYSSLLCESRIFQLRVIKAFKSTLEDMEEKRSVHSLHSLHSLRSSRSHPGLRPMSDISYIDEDPNKTPSPLDKTGATINPFLHRFDDRRHPRWGNSDFAPPSTQTTLSPHRHISRTLLPELPKLVHETSI